jgi:hypothetical protein
VSIESMEEWQPIYTEVGGVLAGMPGDRLELYRHNDGGPQAAHVVRYHICRVDSVLQVAGPSSFVLKVILAP